MRKFALAICRFVAVLCFAPALAQSNHGATVSWVASATTGVTYNVYRQDVACTSVTATSMTLIASTAVGILTFDDTTVIPGPTTCYKITAVLNGAESTGAFGSISLTSPPASPGTVTIKLNP